MIRWLFFLLFNNKVKKIKKLFLNDAKILKLIKITFCHFLIHFNLLEMLNNKRRGRLDRFIYSLNCQKVICKEATESDITRDDE